MSGGATAPDGGRAETDANSGRDDGYVASVLRMVEQGVSVLPVRLTWDAVKSKWVKIPLLEGGFLDATSDPETARMWASIMAGEQGRPLANPRSVPGTGPRCAFGAVADRFCIMDLDGMEAQAEAAKRGLPEGARRIGTMREGGIHVPHRPYEGAGSYSGGTLGRPKGIDSRGGGTGYVVVYEAWNMSAMPEAPRWFRELYRAIPLSPPPETRPRRAFARGTYHDDLRATSVSLAMDGKTEGEIEARLFELGGDHDPKDIRTLARSAYAKFHRESPRPTLEETQLAQAREYVDAHQDDLRVDTITGRWRHYNGRCWEEDQRGHAVDAMATMVEGIGEEGRRRRASTNGYIVGALALAAALPHARVTAEEWDRDGWLLPVKNGTLDLRTATLRPSRPGDLATRFADVEWKGLEEPSPRWGRFLAWAACGSADLSAFLARSAGYWLTGDVLAQRWWLLWGRGGNGKDVFLTCMAGTQGGYAQSSPASAFLHGTDADLVDRALSSMRGARLVYVSETLEMQRLNEALVKSITGKPTIRVRPIYGVDCEMPITSHLVMASNHRPNITDESEGTWRRVLTVPFRAHVEETELNPHLSEELLREEASGILAWRVRGLMDYLRGGLRPPKEVTQSRDDYRSESDVLGQYLALATRPAVGDEPKIRARDNYHAYWVWATDRGERPWTETLLGRRLKDRGVPYMDTKVGRYWDLAFTPEGHSLLSHYPEHPVREEGPSGGRTRPGW